MLEAYVQDIDPLVVVSMESEVQPHELYKRTYMNYNYGITVYVTSRRTSLWVALLLIIPHPYSSCMKAPHRSYATYYTSLAYHSAKIVIQHLYKQIDVR